MHLHASSLSPGACGPDRKLRSRVGCLLADQLRRYVSLRPAGDVMDVEEKAAESECSLLLGQCIIDRGAVGVRLAEPIGFLIMAISQIVARVNGGRKLGGAWPHINGSLASLIEELSDVAPEKLELDKICAFSPVRSIVACWAGPVCLYVCTSDERATHFG